MIEIDTSQSFCYNRKSFPFRVEHFHFKTRIEGSLRFKTHPYGRHVPAHSFHFLVHYLYTVIIIHVRMVITVYIVPLFIHAALHMEVATGEKLGDRVPPMHRSCTPESGLVQASLSFTIQTGRMWRNGEIPPPPHRR